jgi:hypothetical protein
MRKAILTMLLAVVSGGAMAEWVKVGVTEGADHYIDPATIRKDGNFRKAWTLMDLKQRSDEGVMSRRILLELDCKGERVRFLSFSTHSKPMAGGDTLVTESNPDEWQHIAPETIPALILKRACAK